MTSSTLSANLQICSPLLTLTLPPPMIQLGDGQILGLDPNGPEIFSGESGDFSIRYRWLNAEGRIFLGFGQLKALGRGSIWNLEIAPEDGQSWSLQSTTEGSGLVEGWKEAHQLQLFHADNLRGVTQDVFLMDGSYFVGIDEWKLPLNGGRWQSFPGLWLFDPTRDTGIVCGVVSQQVWKHSVHGRAVSFDRVELCGRLFPPGILAKAFAVGESYVGESHYFELTHTCIPAQAFAGYLEALSARLHPSKVTSYLTNRTLWDSWNDRQPHFWDVSMDLLQRTQVILRDHFPAVTSLEVDDGYAFGGFQNIKADIWTQLEHGVIPVDQEPTIELTRRLGVAFAFEEDCAIARDRFPDGVGAAAAKMKTAGFLPGIWLGLNIVRDAKLVQEKPEWTIECQSRASDDPELARIFSGDSSNRLQVLDPSLPEVREYYRQVFKILFREWGYEALKLDFWSYAFENDSFRLSCAEQTALELRRWLFATIREYLPEETYLIACCDISTGNPFFSQWVDTIRYGIDIGNGNWASIRYSALSGTFLLHVEMWRFYFLNADSIGVLKNLPESEKLCFLAWCAATRSLCEIAGDLAFAAPQEICRLQKLLLAPKNGREVRFGEIEHLSRNEPAAIVFAPGDLFSRAVSSLLPVGILGIFNWTDEPKTFEVQPEKFGLGFESKWLDADFFSGASAIRSGSAWSISLPPRSACLSHLSALSFDQPAIIDSNWTLLDVAFAAGTLTLELNGNAAEGFLLHWPFESPLYLKHSNIPALIVAKAPHFFRVAPQLDPGSAVTQWSVELA